MAGLMRPWILTGCAVLAACRGPQPLVEPRDEWRERDEACVAAFRREYARWEAVGESGGVVTEAVGRGGLRQRNVLVTEDRWRLELVLGDRYKSATGLRTESRYRLVDRNGGVLATAESVMASEDAGDSEVPEHVRVWVDPVDGGVLIDEEHNWSTRRRVAMTPGEDGAWRSRVFFLPDRERVGSALPRSTCTGFSGGRVWFSCEDRTYAIPVDRLPEDLDLGYGIG